MSFKFTMPAPDDGRFTVDAFRSQIGRRTTVRMGDQAREAIILAATVAPDGRTAELTVDADLSAFLLDEPLTPGSFGFADRP